ncbi:MAG: hypothetical protein JWL81_2322, partial [Verrucomicrobiales bacterium]|nr:hypothetical protein [Verrucomicrobiales bacterium]
MNTERQQLGLAFGLSAALNLFLFILIAWSMAVHAGLTGSARRLLMEAAASAPPEPETVTLVLSPEPAAPPQPAPGEVRDFQKFINSPADTTETPPSPDSPPNTASKLISDRRMQAASEEEASPDGIPGMISQKGVDQPFLDLRDQDFQSGDPDQPREAAVPPTRTVPAPLDTPPPATTPSHPAEDNPPDPSAPAAAATPEQDSAAPAFRDQDSAVLIPMPAPGARPSPPSRPGTASPPLPVAALPPSPDKQAARENAHAAGTRKSKLLGTISNKGPASLDAAGTPEGKFGQAMHGAIEKHWRPRLKKLASYVGSGAVQLVEIEFEIDRTGRISNVKLVNPDEANPVMQDCALSA